MYMDDRLDLPHCDIAALFFCHFCVLCNVISFVVTFYLYYIGKNTNADMFVYY